MKHQWALGLSYVFAPTSPPLPPSSIQSISLPLFLHTLNSFGRRLYSPCLQRMNAHYFFSFAFLFLSFMKAVSVCFFWGFFFLLHCNNPFSCVFGDVAQSVFMVFCTHTHTCSDTMKPSSLKRSWTCLSSRNIYNHYQLHFTHIQADLHGYL